MSLRSIRSRHLFPIALYPLLRETLQRGPIHLVGGRERQFFDEPDATRMRISRRVGERKPPDFVLARPPSRLAHGESDGLLALELVIDRNDCGLRNVGMALEHALDIGWIDILAAGNE